MASKATHNAHHPSAPHYKGWRSCPITPDARIDRTRKGVKGSKIRSRRKNILVNEPAEAITAQDLDISRPRADAQRRRLRWREPQPSMRTMPIVVIHKASD